MQKYTEKVKLVREYYHKYKTAEDCDSTKTIITKPSLTIFFLWRVYVKGEKVNNTENKHFYKR